MDALTAAVTVKALDGLSLRSVATAQNVANAGTPGYRPVRVTFEAALARASTQGAAAVEAIVPHLEPATGQAGEALRLDLELATASSTAARYAALVEVLNRQLQIEALAVSGGR